MMLRDLVSNSAKCKPEAIAISAPEGCLTYKELDNLSNRFAWALAKRGICRGDRVGIWLEKSAIAVAAMQGALRLGAIYVPLDPLNPPARVRLILYDCEMRALVTTQKRAAATLTDEDDLACLCVNEADAELLYNDFIALSCEPLQDFVADDDEIAYILYTSGSTGKPKGVCISNRNALAFILWAAEELRVRPGDRFANHAPFHFDLSVLDLYVAFHARATVFLIADGISYIAKRLVNFIVREQITIWYSVPSVLVMMMEEGGLLEVEALSLHTILFAGEPFPIKHLRRLYEKGPSVRLLNLYGPTETNVCTFYEVTGTLKERTRPVPIGRACSGDRVWAQKSDGALAQPGEEGELMVTGPTVMLGYWGQQRYGDRPYATGDIVQLLADGNYVYVGRRDHMAKIRGYRVEPGDIEATLEGHSCIHEAAVILVGTDMEARLIAFVVTRGEEAPSLLEIKRYCAERLPRYMIVDAIRIVPELPRTRNGKVDRLRLLNDEMPL